MRYFAKATVVSALTMLLFLGGYRLLMPHKAEKSVVTMSRPGEIGEEIAAMQERLEALGYDVSVTGVYDLMTSEAVRQFQTDRGIDPSGVANAETMYRLGLMVSLDDLRKYEERRFLASTIDAVCPDGSYLVKVALAGLLWNRQKSVGFPDTLPDVVFGEPQFREAWHYDYQKEPTAEAWSAVRDAANGMSPCPDALYYYRRGEEDAFLSTLKTVFKNGRYLFAAPPAE